MQLFFASDINEKTTQYVFDKTESKHIVRVLRKRAGDILFIINGKGLLIESEITIANDKNCTVVVKSIEKKDKTYSYKLHIGIAPTKNIDRFEWFLEKATEIGIDEITPILSEHSERKILKMDRLHKIVESAAKQSLQYHFPKLNEAVTFNKFIQNASAKNLYIAHCEPTEKKYLKNLTQNNKDIIILIGPEGDFSSDEIHQALEKNYVPVSLGESRLRTETAGIIAVATIAIGNQ